MRDKGEKQLFDIEYQLKILPDKSRSLFNENTLGEIIYVGKAKKITEEQSKKLFPKFQKSYCQGKSHGK